MGCPKLLVLVSAICLCQSSSSACSSDKQFDGTITNEEVTITFDDGKKSFRVIIEPAADTVNDLKLKVQESEGFPFYQIGFTLGDNPTPLVGKRKLSEYNIRGGSIVNMTSKNEWAQYTTRLYVNTTGGERHTIGTPLVETVANLKQNLTTLTGIPQTQQRLLLNGRQLRDDRELMHYPIANNTVLIMGEPLDAYRGVVMTLNVKTLSGASFKVDIGMAETAGSLKEEIERTVGVSRRVQRLLFDKVELFDPYHLCDLGLVDGSTVYMVLYSNSIRGLDQVASLKVVPTTPAPNHKAPIFRESSGDASLAPTSAIYRDARNWLLDRLSAYSVQQKFNPVAYLYPNPDDPQEMERERTELARLTQPSASETMRAAAQTLGGWLKLCSAPGPYRTGLNLPKIVRQFPVFDRLVAISLGGGDGSGVPASKENVSPGADVNNWAPDAFTDSDLMLLFELSERVRQLLDRQTRTGEALLGLERQRDINMVIVYSYVEALAGVTRLSEHNNADNAAQQCLVCHDELAVEPAVKLPCGQSFHVDCIRDWALQENQRGRVANCPDCQWPFMFPFESAAKTILEWPEFSGTNMAE